MAVFSNYALRTGPVDGTYVFQNQEITVPDGVYDSSRPVMLMAGGSTFSTTYIGYEANTFHPIFLRDATDEYIIATNGETGNTHTLPINAIVVNTPLELGFVRFDNVAVRTAGADDYTFLGESLDIRAVTWNMGDTLDITFGGVDYELAFSGHEVRTNYPIFRSSDESALDFILTDEPIGSITYIPGEISTGAYTTCFAPGTWIATPDGERAVETLSPGDMVLTADGDVVPVRFVGFQKVPTLFGPREQTLPVRILAGALGRKVPHTDLVVTKDHGMIVDGVICNAGALINGTSIVEIPTRELDTDPKGVATYYHVETENHTVLLANGAAAESFIDNVDRAVFANHGEFVDMYGADVPAMTEMETPRAMSMRQVPPRIRQRLARRAATNPVLVARRAWQELRDWARSTGHRLARGLNIAWHRA